MARRVSVPILMFISLSTLLSTAASLAGGLIMYYEGLKSLHDTVLETSKSELESLRQQLTLPVVAAINNFEALLYSTYAPTFVNDNNSSKWVDVVHRLMFTALRTFPDELSLGLLVAPRDPYSPSALYTTVWSEPLKDGSRSYVLASYDESRKEAFSVNKGTSPPSLSVPLRMNLLAAENGSIGADIGWYDAGTMIGRLGAWDMDIHGGLPDDSWAATNDPNSRILAERWRETSVWVTTDASVHAYTGYAGLFRPPPPPHPWSDYRMVMCTVELWYTMWQRRVTAFIQGKPDTTVVVYKRNTEMVYATTTGDPLVNPACQENVLWGTGYCLTHINNMSLTIQEAYHRMGQERYFDLQTASFDGDEYYALHAPTLDDVEILWLRPTSTIKGKVQKALMYLIIFSVLVLAFDLLVSVSEIFFIAMPLKRLEFAIDHIGAMRTKVALEVLHEYDNRAVVVSEIRCVFGGMLSTTKQLQELKAFMPQSVLYSSDEEKSRGSSDAHAATPTQAAASSQGSRSRSSSSHSSVSGRAMHAKRKTESGNLTRRKRVTAVYCNLRGFLAALHSGSEVLAVHTAYVEEVVQHTRALHGVVDDLSGDRMSLSFNTVRVCGGHEVKGALLAMHVRAIKDAVAGMLAVSVAVCAAPAMVGNVGCTALKKYSIFGTVLGDVRSLLAAGKAWSIAALCNDVVAKQAATSVVMRHVAPALVDGRKMLASEIVEKVAAQAAEEWMYQMARASANPHAVNNDIIEHLYRGLITEAGKLMDGCTCPVARALYWSAVRESQVPWVEVGYVTRLPSRKE